MNIILTNKQLSAQINLKGAELTSLKNSNREYIWEGNPKYWGKHSPVLFPIVGTLKNNSYIHNGTIYALSRHGFARDNDFTVKHQADDNAVFTLVANDETKRGYPFDFELELHYTLKGTTLEIKYVVRNTGNDDMPFSIGAHPAFALPGSFNNYSLKFEQQENLISTQLENDLLSDKTVELPLQDNILPLEYYLFENDALILKTLQSKTVTITENDTELLSVRFNDFPSLGLWTKTGAPFICIEPWQGYSDAENASGNIIEKEGIVLLPPGEEYTNKVEIIILS